MSKGQIRNLSQLWQAYVDNQTAAEVLRKELLSAPRSQFLALLRDALTRPSERLYALRLLGVMSEEDREALMPELLALATWQNQVTDLAGELVFSVPREWLRRNILRCAEPLLQGRDYQEFWGLLNICSRIDPQMALELARRLATHSDPDIRDAGESFISKLELK